MRRERTGTTGAKAAAVAVASSASAAAENRRRMVAAVAIWRERQIFDGSVLAGCDARRGWAGSRTVLVHSSRRRAGQSCHRPGEMCTLEVAGHQLVLVTVHRQPRPHGWGCVTARNKLATIVRCRRVHGVEPIVEPRRSESDLLSM